MESLTTSIIALTCVFTAALLGTIFRKLIPDVYQASDSKDVVRLVMGLVVTTVATALGLLVGSAKSFFDTQNKKVAQRASKDTVSKRTLAQYGPESNGARDALRT